MSCPCGCGRTVKPGYTYGASSCWRRYASQQTAHLRPKCQGCAEHLKGVDVAQGCTRCKACRAKSPGRRKALPKPSAAAKRFSLPRSHTRPFVDTSKPPARESWWTTARPDGFTTLASQQHFSQARTAIPAPSQETP